MTSLLLSYTAFSMELLPEGGWLSVKTPELSLRTSPGGQDSDSEFVCHPAVLDIGMWYSTSLCGRRWALRYKEDSFP